jgi:hypothetical protein
VVVVGGSVVVVVGATVVVVGGIVVVVVVVVGATVVVDATVVVVDVLVGAETSAAVPVHAASAASATNKAALVIDRVVRWHVLVIAGGKGLVRRRLLDDPTDEGSREAVIPARFALNSGRGWRTTR